jgi:hypothetical protein
MITITNPATVNSILGGNAPVGYSKLVLSPFVMNPVERTITGELRLTSTTSPEMPVIQGRLSIQLNTGILEISVQQLDFYRKLGMTAPQIATVQGWITNAQNAIEAGLISVNVVAGVQAAGV